MNSRRDADARRRRALRLHETEVKGERVPTGDLSSLRWIVERPVPVPAPIVPRPAASPADERDRADNA